MNIDRAFFKFTFLGILAINHQLIGSLMSKRKIELTTAPEWYLTAESRQHPDYKIREQALQILKTRKEQKLTTVCLFNQHEVLPNPSISPTQSTNLSNPSESSQISLASSSESFSSKLH